MELADATLDGLHLRVFVMHLALTRRAERPWHPTLGVFSLNNRLGRLFAHLLAQSQHGILNLSQVRTGRLLGPIQQFVDRPFRFPNSLARNSARVADMAHLPIRCANYA